jgi:KUP system potassium uptake protein
VFGVLSLIVYSLLFVVSFKYVVVVLMADNRGEGGILALTALLPERPLDRSGVRPILVGVGILGAALLCGAGMITPAITVLGAIEGLEIATPALREFVVPISVVVLLMVFAIQRYGTHRIGRLYGPVMLVWFIAIAALGVRGIALAPGVLDSVRPQHAIAFVSANGWEAFAVFGAVVLVTTGAEALYADLGHFGRRPIRIAWFALVLPALLLNYFGQGALLTQDAGASRPFFQLAPSWALLPLVVLSTVAAVIASQALISGVFSLTRSAVQLGYAPRVQILHTSAVEGGQVYLPAINGLLAISTVLIVIAFGSSDSLAAAYGIAVTMTMTCTVLLLYVVAVERWEWPVPAVAALTAAFLAVDLTFLGANLLKVQQGGWLALAIAALLFTLMTTWKTGRRLVAQRVATRAVPLNEFIAGLAAAGLPRVPGTAVFMSAQPTGTPPALAHNVGRNKILHECVIILNVRTLKDPVVPPKHRISLEPLGNGVYDVWAMYGFMEQPDVPQALEQLRALGVPVDPADVTYFLSRETLIATKRPGMALWREKLFILLARNAGRPTDYFRLPGDRVVELGVQVEM